MPSPSKPNGCVVPVNESFGTVAVLLFCTPTRVSSIPSYGPSPLAVTVIEPSALIVRRSPHPVVSAPTGGHWVNGGVGGVTAAAGGASAATTAAASSAPAAA